MSVFSLQDVMNSDLVIQKNIDLFFADFRNSLKKVVGEGVEIVDDEGVHGKLVVGCFIALLGIMINDQASSDQNLPSVLGSGNVFLL